MLTSVRSLLDPFFQKPTPKSEWNYGLFSCTHMTERASEIKNKVARYIAFFFAFCFDATIGCGLVGTLLYNAGVFLYNITIAKIKNYLNEKEAKNKWNSTALKIWGLLFVGAATAGLLYYFGTWSLLNSRLFRTAPLSSPVTPTVTSSTAPLKSFPTFLEFTAIPASPTMADLSTFVLEALNDPSKKNENHSLPSKPKSDDSANP